MTEMVDVQPTTIGVGTVIALVILIYGTLFGGTILGLEPVAAALWVLAATFLAVALLHGAFGRRDLAVAFAGAGVALATVLRAGTGARVGLGLFGLVVAGSYVAMAMVRARRRARPSASADGPG